MFALIEAIVTLIDLVVTAVEILVWVFVNGVIRPITWVTDRISGRDRSTRDFSRRRREDRRALRHRRDYVPPSPPGPPWR